MSRQASWQLDRSTASLRTGALAARIDLRRPDLGLSALTLVDTHIAEPAGILAVSAPSASDVVPAVPLDVYQRGPDLIATYGPTDAQPFRYQVYWRAQPTRYPDSLAAIELVVSVQTHLLDSRPRLTATSVVSATAGRRWLSADEGCEAAQDLACPPPERRQFSPPAAIGCFNFRLNGCAANYAEMVHPLDFQSSSLESTGPAAARATRLAHELFAGQLEKGVILRSRVLGLFLPADTPNRMIGEYYRSFVTEELPLTT